MIDPILSLAYLVCLLLDYEAVGFEESHGHSRR